MNLDRERLRGVRVVVTRSREQNVALRELLEARGAEVVDLPTLRFVGTPVDSIRKRLLAHSDYTHVIFTSQMAVEFFAKACSEAGVPADGWDRADMAAVGPATASALEVHGWSASLVTDGGGAALARELRLSGRVDETSRVLIPQSAIARPELEQALKAAGARVTVVGIYDTATETPECAEPFLNRMKDGAPPDAILFASPSAVRAFLELTGDVGERFLKRWETAIISIGLTTSAAIHKHGFEVSVVAEQPGVEGLVAALEAAVGKE